MGVARPGMLIGCGVLAALGILFLSFEAHWFSFVLFILGVIGVFLSFDYGASEQPSAARAAPAAPRPVQPPAAGEPPESADALREHLHELDQLLADRVLSPAEHKRKRAALIEAWGEP